MGWLVWEPHLTVLQGLLLTLGLGITPSHAQGYYIEYQGLNWVAFMQGKQSNRTSWTISSGHKLWILLVAFD